jgi:SnoaL-like domain
VSSSVPSNRDETVDYVAIRRLQDAYADVVTRRVWAELEELFLPNARVEVDTRQDAVLSFDGPAQLGAFIGDALERFDFFEFVILNARVELAVGGDPDRADGRMYMSELRTDRDTGAWNIAFGVYHDRYARLDGRWWFAHRRYHTMGRTGEARDIDTFPFPHHLRLGSL